MELLKIITLIIVLLLMIFIYSLISFLHNCIKKGLEKYLIILLENPVLYKIPKLLTGDFSMVFN